MSPVKLFKRTSTLSVREPGHKTEWRPYFLFLLIARLLVVRLTWSQVQTEEKLDKVSPFLHAFLSNINSCSLLASSRRQLHTSAPMFEQVKKKHYL
jgi:hypothetical protein